LLKLNVLVSGEKIFKQQHDMGSVIPVITTRNKEGDSKKICWYEKCSPQLSIWLDGKM